MKDYSYIYFLTNHHNNVLYVGVTNNIIRRVAEHKANINKGFTYKYNCDKLVYYESFTVMTDAIAREKQLKNWKREWKDKLIHDFNPEWKDLSDEIGVDEEYIESVKAGYNRHSEYSRHSECSRHSELVSESPDLTPADYQEIAGQARNDGTGGNDGRQARNDGTGGNDGRQACNDVILKAVLPTEEKSQKELLNFE